MVAASSALRLSAGAAPHRPGGLTGHLELVCAVDALGRSYLPHQSFRAPMHLSKPFSAGGTLVVNVVNVTAGLLDGDRLRTRVRVERGARLLLSTPSASRVHRMRGGRAVVEQEFAVCSSARLENWPEVFIPQSGARYSQRTTIHVESGGELLFFETLAPGRVASGEAFAYDRLDWSTDIFVDQAPVARERYRLAPREGDLDALRTQFPHGYYGSAYVITDELNEESSCWQRIHELQSRDVWIGSSRIVEHGWAIKLLAQGSVAFRRTLNTLRSALFASLGRPAPPLRRAGDLPEDHAGSAAS